MILEEVVRVVRIQPVTDTPEESHDLEYDHFLSLVKSLSDIYIFPDGWENTKEKSCGNIYMQEVFS